MYSPSSAASGSGALPLAFTFEQVWACYRRYEALLPAAPAPVHAERVTGIRDLLTAFDAFVFDAYGVLNRGDTAIAGAADAFRAVLRTGKPVVVLTNDASGDRGALIAKHGRRGFDLSSVQIVAGIDLLPQRLQSQPDAGRFGYLGPEPRPHPHSTAALTALDAGDVDLDTLAGFVLLEHPGWDFTLQTRLIRSLAAKPRPVLIGNPDITAPVGARLSVEPGYLGLQLAMRAGITPQLLGKPDAGVYQQVLGALHGIPPARILAIGDSLHTDILGGRVAGMGTLLVESGILHGRDTRRCIAASGITPHFVAPAL